MIPLYDNVPTRRFPVVTVALIVANVVAWVLTLAAPAWGLTPEEVLTRLGTVPFEYTHLRDLAPPDLVPWPLTSLSAMFLHGGWLHIIFNMWYLWIFGNNVEDAMGRVRFLVFYLLCGLAAAGGQIAADPQMQGPMIGASGAIAGVLGAYIVLFPRGRMLSLLPVFIFIQVIWVPAWVLLIVWFGLQVLSGILSYGMSDGIAYYAHIGGFAAGVGLVWIFARGTLRERRREVATAEPEPAVPARPAVWWYPGSGPFPWPSGPWYGGQQGPHQGPGAAAQPPRTDDRPPGGPE